MAEIYGFSLIALSLFRELEWVKDLCRFIVIYEYVFIDVYEWLFKTFLRTFCDQIIEEFSPKKLTKTKPIMMITLSLRNCCIYIERAWARQDSCITLPHNKLFEYHSTYLYKYYL
jgi:hypothetical protein